MMGIRSQYRRKFPHGICGILCLVFRVALSLHRSTNSFSVKDSKNDSGPSTNVKYRTYVYSSNFTLITVFSPEHIMDDYPYAWVDNLFLGFIALVVLGARGFVGFILTLLLVFGPLYYIYWVYSLKLNE